MNREAILCEVQRWTRIAVSAYRKRTYVLVPVTGEIKPNRKCINRREARYAIKIARSWAARAVA